MKRVLAPIGAILLMTAPLAAQEMSPEEAAAMQAWTAYMTPGEAHQMLAKHEGEWNHTVTMWMAPGAPPSESTATSTNRMIMGGRYLVETLSGSFEGMPFEGHGMYGYDNAKKKYFMTWIDNFGTGLMTGWGDWDPASRSMTYEGTFLDPMTSQEKSFRSVTKWVDDGHTIYEMYMPGPDGQEFKSMEIHSLRKTG